MNIEQCHSDINFIQTGPQHAGKNGQVRIHLNVFLISSFIGIYGKSTVLWVFFKSLNNFLLIRFVEFSVFGRDVTCDWSVISTISLSPS